MVPAIAFFLWQSLRGRVQGNWPSFLYPAFAVAAVAASLSPALQHWRALRWSARAATPVALVMTGLIYAQAVLGIVPVVREPISRMLAVGIGRVTDDIEILRAQNNAKAILTTSYEMRGWLSFYLPTKPPVIQVNERFRWLNEPPPAAGPVPGAAALCHANPQRSVGDAGQALSRSHAARPYRALPQRRHVRRVQGLSRGRT